jgi:tetratricopeptide (TPR) repeat protein
MEGTARKIRGLIGLLLTAAIMPACSGEPDEETLLRYARARGMYAEGRFSEAASLLSGMKRFSPALILLGKAEYFAGEGERAEAAFRRAVKLNPSAFEARLYLARILRGRGEREEAEGITESLLADNPQDIRVLRFGSGLAREGGKTAEAAALLDQAAELSAESALVFLDRARLRWIAGRGEDALEDLGRARAMLPRDTPLLKSIEHLESLVREAL